VLVLVPAAYIAAFLVTFYLSRAAQLGSHPIFPAPAIILVGLLRSRPATWPALLLTCGAAEVWFNFDNDWFLSVLNCTVNLSEGLCTAGLLRLVNIRTWYLSIRWFVLCVCFALASVASVCAIGVAVVYLAGHSYWAVITPLLYSKVVATDALSIALAAPLLLSWTEPALRHNLTSWRLVQAVALIAVTAGGASAAFFFSNSIAPMLLIFPLLGLLTLRTGLPGATAGAVAVTAVGAFLTAKGIGPIASYPGLEPGARILFLQLYFLAAMLSSLPVAVILSLRTALSDKVKEQGAISDAALSNMAQGLSMFDRQDRLITCNRRFANLYELPDCLTAAGTSVQAILEHSHGDLSAGKLKAFVQELVETGDPGRTSSEIRLPDGRIISIYRRRLADGGWVATHEDVTQRRLAEERVSYLANHDPLTGLSNRTCFHQQLQASLRHAGRGHAFALLALDLDRFKAVNDTFGHAAGDELLKQVAARLQSAVRQGDLVTRLGGDEFAILQFGLKKPEETRALAARIVEVIGKPFTIFSQEVEIGASVGIALAPEDTAEAAELMQKSDLALYRAKAGGRNGFRFYKPEMDATQQARQSLEAELRSAIKHNEFELYYQPIVDANSGAISCLEALIRWRHPTRGLIAPDDFIGVAEETGLIMPIGEFVLKAACREAAAWPSHVKVAVNLSPVQFKGPGLVALVRSALKQARLEPSRLELEITESALLQNSQIVLKALHQLRNMGVGIAMDDFGTGYSSLSYLCSFPFDKIKIDRSFIADMTVKNHHLAIVHAAIELSARLGMTSTAEGVETAEEYALLEAEGCTNLQGYYISRPLPARRVAGLIARHARSLGGKLSLAS
jgi:diguanylate cyclase (GGDEF)-like protein